MSSGNPFGLAEISHFGSFQRVGGKAGGFINKKFFHPSSFKNQEKLWQVMTADATEKKKQKELEKRRDEERQVEELRKQMYLAGQGKQLDNFSQAEAEEAAKDLTVGERASMKVLHETFRMRKETMKSEQMQREQKAEAKAAGEESSDDDEDEDDEHEERRELAKSRYEEDQLVLGHTCVWGSWYTKEGHKWGFKCCHGIDAKTECPMCIQPNPEPSPDGDKKERPLGTKRARRRAEKASLRAAAAEAQAGEPAASPTPSPLPDDAAPVEAAAASSSSGSSKPIVDESMLARAEARRSGKRQNEEQEMGNKKPKDSSYLANLLADPTA